jgi:hypothetical protein
MSGMHHRRQGYPFGTLVDFATDGAGMPIFCLSPLAIHARNLVEDARCSLVVQMPGWTGLANARVTIFGDVYKLPMDLQVEGKGGRGASLGGQRFGVEVGPDAHPLLRTGLGRARPTPRPRRGRGA